MTKKKGTKIKKVFGIPEVPREIKVVIPEDLKVLSAPVPYKKINQVLQ